jgi:hypothetical protein
MKGTSMNVRPIIVLTIAGLALLVGAACDGSDTRTPTATGAPQATPKITLTATPEPAPTVVPTTTPQPMPTTRPTVGPERTTVAAPTATPAQAAGSGIQGQALMGPMCPVVRSDEPCPDRAIQATIDVWNVDRTRKITSFTTDADGRFAVALPPGEYLLDPQSANPNGGFPFGRPQTVVVQENTYTAVTVSYDTGIR